MKALSMFYLKTTSMQLVTIQVNLCRKFFFANAIIFHSIFSHNMSVNKIRIKCVKMKSIVQKNKQKVKLVASSMNCVNDDVQLHCSAIPKNTKSIVAEMLANQEIK